MQMFTCSSCGKAWPENYCPDCAHTIDRGLLAPPRIEPASPRILEERRALETFSRTEPPLPQTPPPVPDVRPVVVPLYRIWCALILIVYVALGIREGMILAGTLPPQLGPVAGLLSSDDPAMRAQMLAEERQNSFIGLAIAVIGAILFFVGVICPRAPWAWIWGIVAIVVSVFPLCVSLAGAVPLLIFWLKPGTKRYFGFGTQ
jgi:hypothetical protein